MQRYFELKVFNEFLESEHVFLNGKDILDVGCGSGYGLQLLDATFTPRRLVGIDLLQEEVLIARNRNPHAQVLRRDLVATRFPARSFDAVFIFTVLHHVPEWRAGLCEMNRILKTGGVLLVDELNKQLVRAFQYTTGVKHPSKAQFQWREFQRGLVEAGFSIKRMRFVMQGFGLFLCTK